jgi:acyl carrier protein
MSADHVRPLSSEEEQQIRDSLKRCSAESVEAAVAFRKTGNADLIATVVIGILARFLEPEQRPKLVGDCDSLRLMDDLGVDSLTMVEVVMLVEETLVIKIDNEDLRDLRSIGDVKAYVNAKARGLPTPEKPMRVDIADIASVMPQQPPFLFVQEAELRAGEAKGVYKIAGQEFFLEGHFKGRPVFPASIQLEALGQLGVLFLLKGKHAGIEKPVNPETIFFMSADGVRCSRICLPGDVLSLSVKVKRIKHPIAVFEGQITVNGEKASFAEEIALTFDYAAEPVVDATSAVVDATSAVEEVSANA